MSEWGRDGVRTSGSSGGRAVVVFLSLAALAVAGTDIASRLGYFNLPFQQDQQAQLAIYEQEISQLEQSLAQARKSAAASPQLGDLQREIDRRDHEIARLNSEHDAILSGEVESAISLRSELDQLREIEVPALEKELGARDRALDEMEVRLKLAEEVTSELQSRLDKAFNVEIAQLRQKVSEREAVAKTLDDEIARLAPLEAQLQIARQALEDVSGKQNGAMDKLASDKLAAGAAKIFELENAISGLKQQASESDAARLQSGTALAASQAEVAALTSQIKQLQASQSQQSEPTTKPAEKSQNGLIQRDPGLVARALSEAKGLRQLTTSERDRIAAGLIEGECVGKVLAEVLGRAPALALRDLIRALDSDC